MATSTKTRLTKTQALASERADQLVAEAAERDQLQIDKTQLTEQETSILASWTSGDTSIGADQMDKVRGELERVSLLLSAAERRVKVAMRKQINLDDDLAVLLVPAIKSAYAVPVEVATVEPSGVVADLPLLTIVQLAPAGHRFDIGSITGEVELFYARTEAHAPLTKERLTKHFKAAGVQAQVGSEYGDASTSQTDGGQLDRITVKVQRIFAPTPSIHAPGSVEHVRQFGEELAYQLEGAYVVHSNTGQPSYPQRFKTHGAKLVDRTTDKGQTSIKVAVDIDYGRSPSLREDVAQRIPFMLQRLVSKGYAGLGRLESAQTTSTTTLMGEYGFPTGTATTIEAVFTSKTPA